jgi:hypothetical protein
VFGRVGGVRVPGVRECLVPGKGKLDRDHKETRSPM